jgi:hypothetical protein
MNVWQLMTYRNPSVDWRPCEPLGTHHPCSQIQGNVVASGQIWATSAGLVAEVAHEGPMHTGDDYPHDMECPSRDGSGRVSS